MSSIDQDSKLVEAATFAAAAVRHPELFSGDPDREHRAASPYLVDHAKGVALAKAELIARAIIPIVLEEAAGVAGSFATKARGREPENVYDSALYTAGHTIAAAIRSLASDVKEEGR